MSDSPTAGANPDAASNPAAAARAKRKASQPAKPRGEVQKTPGKRSRNDDDKAGRTGKSGRPGNAGKGPKPVEKGSGAAARRVAQRALVRIAEGGAFANIVLSSVIEAADPPLSDRDRRLVTELVYGTTRRQRACDWYVDRFVSTEPDAEARAFLRLGAYQLAFTDIPPYAAVDATVSATPLKIRGFVNAVLRKALRSDSTWPSEAVRLSYPDWILERLVADLGETDALAALESMNEAAVSHAREDGYVQDLASQWVAGLVGGGPGERILDLCGAPGGKATAIAASGAFVVAADLHEHRCRLIAENRVSTGVADHLGILAADGTAAPFRPASFDRILIDAPCSGLGSLRRRADARWRIDADAVDRLVLLQRALLAAAVPLLRPGGTLTYAVCTLTAAETLGIDEWLAHQMPSWEALAPPTGAWRAHGRGALLLPQVASTDGMFVITLQHPGGPDGR